MTKLLLSLVFFTYCCFFACESFAQTADTLKNMKSGVLNVKASDGLSLKPVSDVKQLKQPVTRAVNQARSKLGKKLSGLKKSPVDFNLILGEGLRYNPVPVYPAINNSRSFLNILSVQGNINLYGIPINVNYSTDRASAYGTSNPYNDLFKFDYQPNQFNALFQSELQQYVDLRRAALDGRNLTGYTRKEISYEINAHKGDLAVEAENSLLSNYLNDAEKLNALLLLDKAQIKAKLWEELTREVPLITTPQKLSPGSIRMLSADSLEDSILQKLSSKKTELQLFADNAKLSGYFGDASNLSKLRLMNEDQITEKIIALSDSSLSAVRKDSISAETARQLARRVMVSVRQENNSGWSGALKDAQNDLDRKLEAIAPGSKIVGAPVDIKRRAMTEAEKIQLNDDIDNVAETITGIKEGLTSKGMEVKKMLLMQKYMETGGVGFSPESANVFLSQQPKGAFQQVFSRLGALKVGAFSNQPSGAVQDKDLFMKGGNVTIKSGGIPITFGYGSVNDLSSSKDNQFQNSVYNQPRNITYIGAELKRAGAGNLSLSVISAQSRNGGNSLYATPAISSNNVAITLSKKLALGKLGDFGFDVSKSSTVYSNKYQVGAEAVLDQKGGLNYNLSNDLFQSLSFGVDHHQDFESIGASDNVYFKYSGMGYQNPATNGFGGAKMKFGGNIRKSFDNNKLIVNMRSDITNMPISYTSSDRWKNYQFQLESRYQLNKKVNLSLKYITNGTGKQIDGVNSSVYSFQKIQFDGNASYKIGKYRSVSHFTIGDQAITNSFAPQSGSAINIPAASGATTNGNQASRNGANLLIFNYTQSLIIHQNVLTANVFVNRELTGYKLIGNLLNSDIAYQFLLLNKLNISSGITYLDNAGIARQAGIRESISLMAGSRFNIETFVDIRKNIIRPLYPDLYANYRAQLSIFYRISH